MEKIEEVRNFFEDYVLNSIAFGELIQQNIIREKFDEWIEGLKNINTEKIGEFVGRIAATVVNYLKNHVVDRIEYFFEHPEEFFSAARLSE